MSEESELKSSNIEPGIQGDNAAIVTTLSTPIKAAEKKKDKWKWARRFAYGVIWLLIISNVFGIDMLSILLSKYSPESYVIFFNIYHFYIYGILLILALIIFKIHRLIFWFFGFLALPPYLLLIFIPRFSFKALYKIITILSGTNKTYKSFRFKLSFFVLWILAVVAILRPTNKHLVVVAMIIIFGDFISHFIKRFRSLSAPIRIINSTSDFLFNGWEKIKNSILLKNIKEWQAMDPSDEKYNQKKAESLSAAWILNRVFYRLAKYLKRAENIKVLSFYFIYAVAKTFFYTILSFSLEYYALTYISPGSISGLKDSFWNSIYFSFSTLITMNYGDIIPISGLAKIMTSLEAFSSLLIGVILFFIFTTIVLEKYKRDIDVLSKKLSEEEVIIKQFMTREFNKGLKELLLELSYIKEDGSTNLDKKHPKFFLPDDSETL